MNLMLLLLLAYIFGSIPFSVYIPRIFGIDILRQGSKNPGFTNVLRVAGIKLGVVCLLFDMLKGFLPAIIAMYIPTAVLGSTFSTQCLAGFFGVLGHCYSPFLKFKGGKGVAAAGGLVFALDLRLVPILAFSLILILILTKYMSVASMTTSVLFPLSVIALYGDPSYAIMPAVYSAFIIFKHRGNIVRLLHGTENKFRVKK